MLIGAWDEPTALRKFGSGWLCGVLGLTGMVAVTLGGWQAEAVAAGLTPRLHHWHHGLEKEAADVNFAVRFPFLDKICGAHHLPVAAAGHFRAASMALAAVSPRKS